MKKNKFYFRKSKALQCYLNRGSLQSPEKNMAM